MIAIYLVLLLCHIKLHGCETMKALTESGLKNIQIRRCCSCVVKLIAANNIRFGGIASVTENLQARFFYTRYNYVYCKVEWVLLPTY